MDLKPIFCPFCGVSSYRKYGKRNGKQRYLCSCGKIFLDTSGTIFSSTKLDKDTLRRLIILIIDDTKIEAMKDVLGISIRTAYMWRMKIYKAVAPIVAKTKLYHMVWIDEKMISVNNRMVAVKPDGLRFRGNSFNQVVVACAIDFYGNRYAEIIGRGHTTSKQCLDSYGKHINPGSHIIHDGLFSHRQFIERLGCTDEMWKPRSNEARRNMQPINSFCSEIERNLVVHIGSRTENLQDYLNWIVFKSTINSENIDRKVDELVTRCFQSRVTYKIKDRYNR